MSGEKISENEKIVEIFHETTDGEKVSVSVGAAVRRGIRAFLTALPERALVRDVIAALEEKW
ncbi:hypothetical protein [Acetobacter sp. DsW_063]|uniref:hypothetical protein n=1 Tax=Acetobacter sp. DsW_063 TaxID=1514894 RepID=UPI000A3A9CBC|nr:hypothetical protein [Acetobacter sp. DsW_063]OUJ17085.1 hypothetical protein HK28_07910 [Acetobacter sp. DsW_063]